MSRGRIPLAEVLESVTAALRDAHANAMARGNPVMGFQECELEFAVDVEGTAEGGVKAWVLNLEAGAKRSETNTIRIKFAALPDSRTVAEVEAERPRSEPPRRRGRKE